MSRSPSRAGGAGGRGVSGFTLLEMIVVISIISTLALIVGPSVFRNVGDANVATARTQIELVSVAIESYRIDTGEYPDSEQGLNVLRQRPLTAVPGWRGPYLRRPVPEDPWGRPYVYRVPGEVNPESFDLYSLGRDGSVGGEGEDEDITSWGEALVP